MRVLLVMHRRFWDEPGGVGVPVYEEEEGREGKERKGEEEGEDVM